MLDLSTEAIFAWDLNGAIIYWNKGAEKMYGFSSEEAVGSVSHDLLRTVHPIEIDDLKSVLAKDGAWSGEIEHTCKDGRKLLIETRHQVIRDESGKMIVLETNRDITERKRAEEELHRLNEELEKRVALRTEELSKSNEELNVLNEELMTAINEELTANSRQLEEEIIRRKEYELELQAVSRKVTNILESISDAFYALDQEWRFTYVNAEARRQIGIRDESEVIGKAIWDVFPNSSDITHDMYHRAVSEQTPVRFEVNSQVSGRWNDIHAFPSPEGLSVYFLDVTERKKAEESLRLSEERFSKAFQSGPTMGVIRSLNDNRIIEVNDNFLKVLEYERYEVVGHTAMELGYWADREAFEQAFQELNDKVESRDKEVDLQTKSGKIIRTLFYTLITEIDGKTCALVNFVDITERKRMEEDLRSSENQLKLITDSLPSLISYIDAQHRYKFVNRAYENWFGRKREDVLGKYNWEVIGEKAYQEVQTYVESALSGEQVAYELEIPYKDGGTRFTYSILVPDPDDSGAVSGYISLVNDMTEIRALEQQIADALEFNRAIVESSTLAIYAYNSSGRCIFTNDAGVRISGRPKEQILQLNINDFEHWKQTGLLDAAKRVLSTGAPEHLEVNEPNVFGKQAWWDFRFSRFTSVGEPHLLLLYEDITERKHMEQEIAEALELNRTMLESSPIGILTFDSSGQVVYANEVSINISGGQKEQLLQQNINRLESWKQNGLLDIAKWVLETGAVERNEIHIPESAFGKEFWFNCNLSRFTSGGEPHLLLM